ncbi:lipoyl synthase [Candidatus Woesearchaeota archaeon]|nr:lipoyl synthase [Candidatus Woesearchaeota archaeon]
MASETKVKPDWVKIKAFTSSEFDTIKNTLNQNNLKTVCHSASCPNIFECWNLKTATFLILGDTCTRNCLFCGVKKGNPNGLTDAEEKTRLISAIKSLNLKYVVLTSVDRDDLKDYGASHFSDCIKEIKKIKSIKVEALIPDFNSNESLLKKIASNNPDVVAHNIETVERLSSIRDKRASYIRSLKVLDIIKKINSSILTKSSLLLGLGETEEEVIESMKDLRKNSVDILVLGQYLKPNKKCIDVKEYITPKKFKYYKNIALRLGFQQVLASPFARSSYKAGEIMANLNSTSILDKNNRKL